MKCVLKYPKKENTKRPEPTNNFDSGRILSINSSLIIQKWHYFRSYFPVLAPLGSLFETSYFIFTFSFLGKQLIISLLEKKLSGLPSQSAFLSQAVGLFSAAIPRALVGRGWLLNSLRR